MQASEAIEKAQIESTHIKDNIRVAADWFHDREGDLVEKGDAVSHISDISEIDFPLGMSKEDFATRLIHSLAGDHVDPVQQVNNPEGKFIGVIEYDEHDGYYTFTEFNDISGEHIRGVCGECVADSTRSSEPFTRHTGEYGSAPLGDKEQLHEILEQHIGEEHGGETSNIETGATLASGTTIAGNTAVHLGNESFVDEGGDTMSGTLTANGSPSVTTGGSIRINTGSDIQDGSGTGRLSFNSSSTSLRNDAGDFAVFASSGTQLQLSARSTEPIVFRDREGGFDALQYTTDPSTGTLELTNADLEVGNTTGGDVRISGELTEGATL